MEEMVLNTYTVGMEVKTICYCDVKAYSKEQAFLKAKEQAEKDFLFCLLNKYNIVDIDKEEIEKLEVDYA